MLFGFSLIGVLLCLLLTWQYTLLDPISLLLEWLGVSLPGDALPELYSLLEGFMAVSTQGVILTLLAVAVFLLVRRLRCSKTVCLVLWAAVALRLLLPFQLPSSLSLFNLDYFSGIQTAAARDLDHEFTGDYEYTVPGWKNADAALEDGADIVPGGNLKTPHEFIYYYEANGAISAAVSREDGFGGALALVWAGGVLLLLGYGIVSYLLLKRRLRFAVKDEILPNVWYSDRIFSPCVAGFFRPRIYLTFGLSDMEKEHILAHERQHIKNGDHIWKLLAWLVVSLHWLTIHPVLLMLVYGVFLWNLEEACDQRVLLRLGEGQKADYGQSLLSLSTGRRFRPGPSPIAFGEGDTKDRVRSILRYKKPLAIFSVLALAVVILLAVTLSTNRVKEGETPTAQGDYTITGVVGQTLLSSSTDDYFLEKSLGTTVHLSEELFSIEGEGSVDDVTVRYPIYRAMELEGGTLPNFIHTDENGLSEEPLLQIPLPEGTRGWQVMTSEEHDSGYRVFVMDGYIWVGKWVSHGTVGTISEYWYIIEAAPSREEPGHSDDATPTATTPGDPVETAPAIPDDTSSHWEDLVLNWTFPKNSEDPVTYGFPLHFSFPFDYFDASCAGGSPYAYRNGVFLSGHPIEGATSSILRWWPYEEGSSTPAETASITAGVYQDGDRIFACSLVFNLAEETRDTLTYSVRATLHGHDDYIYLENPQGAGGGEIRPADDALPETLATRSADLTHDGADERIAVVGDYEGQIYYVNVYSPSGQKLWHGQAATAHAGQNGIYLYEEQGKYYLMEWCNYGISGSYSITYRVFSLSDPGGETVLITERAENFMRDDFMSIDTDSLRSAEEESRYLLSHSIVLASTNGDTPDSQCYSTAENPISPIIGKSIWGETPSADYFDALQAKAQGTYTFQGEVVSILDNAIMVADESLWTEEGYGYCFTIPVDDPAQFYDGEKVTVTADGPLYRHQLPDDGTTVTVEPLT